MLERLQKIIARAGIASRRHAEELIRSGQVRVNGVVITELGSKADPERDRVVAAGRIAERPVEPAYFLLHKPVHVVSTMSDPEGRATLRHVLRGLAGGVFPVGRLDYAASGLMLLTSDGHLADRIFRTSARMPQVYWVKVAGRLTDDEMQRVRRQAYARMRRLRAPGSAGSEPANPWYEVELSDARRDLLRRALFSLGHPLEKMKRVKLGPLDLGDLAEGHYRRLEPREVAHLRRFVEKPVAKTSFLAASHKEREAPLSRPAPSSLKSEKRKWHPRPPQGNAAARPEKREGRRAGRQRGKSRPPTS
jgi:23S rRNA pseudouridine2605 synthase